MLPLLLALLCSFALAAGPGDWPEAQLRADLAGMLGPEAEVLGVQGVTLASTPPTVGAILGTYRQGAWTFGHVLTVFERGGQSWISPGWGAGGCEAVVLLGVLDLEGEGSLTLEDGWAGPAPQEPVARPKQPALVLLSRERFEDGVMRTEALVLDLADPERPFQRLREVVGTRLPIWDPRSDMPVQRSLGTQALSLGMVRTEAGLELQLVQRDVPTPDARCSEPRPETRHFQLQEGRFVESYPRVPHEPCP